jgi:four helix bundle suffix protein
MGKDDITNFSESLWQSVFAANGALSLLNLCIYLLNQQMKAQAKAFENEGDFTERLYRQRSRRRQESG